MRRRAAFRRYIRALAKAINRFASEKNAFVVVIGMEGGVPICAVSMDERLDGIMKELALDKDYLHHAGDQSLAREVYTSMKKAGENPAAISGHIIEETVKYKEKLNEMGLFLKQYLSDRLPA